MNEVKELLGLNNKNIKIISVDELVRIQILTKYR